MPVPDSFLIHSGTEITDANLAVCSLIGGAGYGGRDLIKWPATCGHSAVAGISPP